MMDIDREIAEKVMKWEFNCVLNCYEKLVGKDHFAFVENWHPSTDIKQAFEVVEKMLERDMFFSIRSYKNGWECTVYNMKDVSEVYVEKTPALAICKAALKAVGAETE